MAKKPTTQVNKWDETLAADAEIAAASEVGGGGSKLSFRGGAFHVGQADLPDRTLNVIILDHLVEYAHYEGDFDADDPRNPVCFALGRKEAELQHHELATDPKCAEGCAKCPMNRWGSSDKGKGKACKNIRRIALVMADAAEENAAEAEVYMARIPVTSVGAWTGYVQQLAQSLKRPPYAVITQLSLVPDKKSQFKVQFKLVEPITDGDMIQALRDKKDGIQERLTKPYEPQAEEEEEEVPAPKKPAKKTTDKTSRRK